MDEFFPVLERYGERIEELEDEVVAQAGARDAPGGPPHQARPPRPAAHRLARARGDQQPAARGGAPDPPGDAGLPARLLRPRDPGDRHDRDLPRPRRRPARRLPLQRQQPPQRGDEGADHHLDHLHPAELHRRRLRHELRPPGEPAQHARARLVLRLPGRADGDGGHRRPAGALSSSGRAGSDVEAEEDPALQAHLAAQPALLRAGPLAAPPRAARLPLPRHHRLLPRPAGAPGDDGARLHRR